MKFHNPIVPGYNPDPSICRKDDTFYLVNSSFEFFPGVPLRKSKNLVNWSLTGCVLDRESQLPLTGCNPSGGIFAPTIRYHDGMFYMITTNVNRMWMEGRPGNFIVHAENPEGPWSEPAWIDQMGIDPSVFFDDDGSCWYTGTGHDEQGTQGIVFFKLDPMTGEILSDKKVISRGSGGKCPEGPHMYKKDGWYYLMLAEGGTEFGHMETIARSRNIEGPYEFNPAGPLLTARNTNGYPIQCTGHADLVDDQNGGWWVVSLGTRPIGPMAHHLGRETFLGRIDWVDGWPVMRNDGLMEMEPDFDLPCADTVMPVSDDIHCDFTNMDKLPADFTWLRNPVMQNYQLDGCLLLHGTDQRLSTPNTTPTFVGIRQTQFVSCSAAVLNCDIPEGCSAGITAYGIHSHHYDLLITRRYGKLYAQLRKHLYDMETVASEIPLSEDAQSVTLRITSDRSTYSFAIDAGNGFVTLGSGYTIGLATEVTEMMTFTGAFIGLFAENGAAKFSSFDYTAEWKV